MKVHHAMTINWRGAGPCWAPGDKVSLCPHFWFQDTAFLQPPWPSLLLKGRLEQSLIREGRGYEKNSQEQPWGKVLFSHQWIHTTIPVSYLAEPERPSRWEKLPINFGILPTRLPRWRSGKQFTCQQKRWEDSILGWGRSPWRRKWQPTPIFLPGKFHGQRSLVGYSPWGRRVRHDWAGVHAAHKHEDPRSAGPEGDSSLPHH